MQNRLTEFFRRSGLEPCIASGSGEALAFARDGGLRLGVIDSELPQLGGLEVVRILGRLVERVPCILTARRPSKEAQLSALDAGAFTVLETPFSDETLRFAVERVVLPSDLDPIDTKT
jgi:DNA-binding response OmpR family regulator